MIEADPKIEAALDALQAILKEHRKEWLEFKDRVEPMLQRAEQLLRMSPRQKR